jgi:hypothetical protein
MDIDYDRNNDQLHRRYGQFCSNTQRRNRTLSVCIKHEASLVTYTSTFRLANSLQPGAIKKVNQTTMAFKQMENISFFLQFVEKFVPKTELFQTVDLFESQVSRFNMCELCHYFKDPNAVLLCLASLARKVLNQFLYSMLNCNNFSPNACSESQALVRKSRSAKNAIGRANSYAPAIR